MGRQLHRKEKEFRREIPPLHCFFRPLYFSPLEERFSDIQSEKATRERVQLHRILQDYAL